MTVDAVAVDVNPTIWGPFCEECDQYIGASSLNPGPVIAVAKVHEETFHHSRI